MEPSRATRTWLHYARAMYWLVGRSGRSCPTFSDFAKSDRLARLPPDHASTERNFWHRAWLHGMPAGNGFYHFGQDYIYASIRQPVELGHQTTHRYRIAQAAYDQQKWIVVQAELTALVQTYRFFQTAAYRREKYQLAEELAKFNDHLQETLERRMEANQVQPADVTLARVETRATRQQVKAARQDYLTALTDLRNQIGIPEQAGAFEPLGEFTLPPYIPPIDEQTMVQEALLSRPDIQAARAIAGTHSAVDLAKGDRIPTPIIGPEYQMDEAGVQYVGFVFIAPIPIWNNGKPLVIQREAEHHRAIVAYKEATARHRSGEGSGRQVERGDRACQRLSRAQQGPGRRSWQNGAAVRGRHGRLDQADASQAAVDPAREFSSGRGLGRDASPGRPSAGAWIPSMINDMINRAERDDTSGVRTPGDSALPADPKQPPVNRNAPQARP